MGSFGVSVLSGVVSGLIVAILTNGGKLLKTIRSALPKPGDTGFGGPVGSPVGSALEPIVRGFVLFAGTFIVVAAVVTVLLQVLFNVHLVPVSLP
jgi:hypothetical protein